MNILELDSYNLADAVKFNKALNPRIWQKEQMRPEVRDKLLEIAADFKEFLGLSDLEVKDITVSGSNAGYTYTPYSDIDLHLVVDIPRADSDEVYRELFDAKKFQYNEMHNIKIGGYDVELYVENANKPPVSQGVFSVLNNDWINIPKRSKATVDDDAVRSKYEDFAHRIDDAVNSNDVDRINTLAKKIKTYRQAGLDAHGELGPENLAYKMLRNQGYIKKLYDARSAAKDAELSLAEQNKVKKPFVYGYSSVAEDVTSTPDGVGASTRMFLSEKPTLTQEEIIRDFLNFAVEELEIDNVPKLRLKKDPAWSIRNKSFGRYDAATGELIVALGNRHVMDVLRTLAHELTHRKQDETETMPPDAGETGSSYENEANALAGVLMRNYAGMHPEYFEDVAVNEASGYIPTRAQAKDPRFNMALTVDVHPGQTGKEANKMALKTDKQGKPALVMKATNQLAEDLERKYGKSKGQEEPWDRDGYEPPGPEFPPQMPAGTTKIDVKDLSDWYQIGMDISDMDDADPEDYNQGPPQTVVVFPSDELEQSYLKQFKRLGLKTHDIDPDVEGGEDTTGKHMRNKLAEELEAFKEQDLFEVKMTSKNLANLAKDIKGAKVGLEFEMIVPNVKNDEDSNQEPDYDQDERVRDIDDAVNFFDDGDYNSSREVRRLREQMESDYFNWQTEQIDQDWANNGFEFFQEYLDREEPFDPTDYEDRAEDEIKAEFPELDPTSEDFGELVAEKLREINAEYYNETWQMEGRGYDNAREEFEEEKKDEYDENAWLDDRGIRFASDVQNEYSDVQWPYWSSVDGGEGDIESVALDFMNAMGMDSVAISSSYHGSYKKWLGSGWVSIGSNKPDDCFTIEPDGSLEGDDSSDTGLEFVSPPIPLEDIGTVMSKVQNWAGNYGAYTGDQNKTSIHTNISIPGYDLDKLDYLKAALLLGDEYVLREFDRIGNTYAAPAIEKVKALVKQKPEKAQELLDKMKSQLNAEASKLIHSGQTNKFTSINTKDNRVEFRSPGGDYLSIIADNPQKMVDTINRMVVTLDAAMDPDKYKQEYQKKLYKVLTGQAGGREATTGAKQEMKASDKDLLNIFSRYAAGELPKAALKSFVRQAQLERKVNAGKTQGKMWWNVQWTNGRRIEVVADSKEVAKQVAAEEWGVSESQLAGAVVTPLRPYEEKPEAQQPAQQQEGNWGIWITSADRFIRAPGQIDNSVLRRFPSREAAEQFLAQTRAERPDMRADIEVREIEPAAQTQPSGLIYIVSYELDDGQTGRERVQAVNADAAVAKVRLDLEEEGYEVVSTEVSAVPAPSPAAPVPGSTLDLQRQRAAQPSVDTTVNYEIYNRQTGQVMEPFQVRNDDEATTRLDDYRQHGPHSLTPQQAEQTYGVRRGPGVTNTAQQSNVNNLTPRGPGPWELASVNNNQVYFNPEHTNRGAAETEARTWIQQMGLDPAEFEVRTRESVSSTDAAQGGIVDVAGEQPATGSQVGQTYNPSGTESFTGQWLILNPNNQVIYRFGGIGNAQSDANRIAMDWLTQNPQQMVDGVTVVPEMG